MRLQFCFENDIARVLARAGQTSISSTSASPRSTTGPSSSSRASRRTALRAIPVRLHPDGDVSVAVADPTDDTLLPTLKLATGPSDPAARDDALGAPGRLGDGVPAGLGPPGLRHRLRQERLLQRAQHLRALALEHRHEPAELEPRQLDRPGRAHGPEAEVGRGSRAGRPCGGRGSARSRTRPRGSGTRTPRAPPRPCPSPRRSRRGRATAAPTGSSGRRGRRR